LDRNSLLSSLCDFDDHESYIIFRFEASSEAV
jgi:hypothetical protein